MRKPPPKRPMRIREPEHRINERIMAAEVRIVGSENEMHNGLIPLARALEYAQELGVDLVEISNANNMPICKLIEYSKYKYEVKKKEKENKARQHQVEVKEIRFGPNTDEHDFNFKARHAEKFLKEGNKIKAYVTFHGRSIVHKDRGEKLLLEFAEVLEPFSKVESAPKLEGKRMFLFLAPKSK
ncbi:MAG: translation initiation factor IF-3 [Bacteroidetes bacterium]|nr:translation initiation factor IF-3 [Bacteroidota bacterium]